MAIPVSPPYTGFRFLGNTSPSKKEVHDLNKKTANCQINEIRNAVRFVPDTLAQAHSEGYDNCNYCIGGSTR